MSAEKPNSNGLQKPPTAQELGRMIDNGEWDKVKALLTPTPEEVESMLTEPTIDAAEVNRVLGITDEEIAEVAKSPAPEMLPRSRRSSNP